jgi:3-hydroxybutyryl-CoA dehydrogenase
VFVSERIESAVVVEEPMQVERVAVVGAGLMGHGIAQVFAEAGVSVAVWDPNPEVRASVPDRVRANLRSLGWPREAADQVVERVAVHETLEPAVEAADAVIEAAPEDLATKQQMFERLGALTGPATMLATNTSVISVGRITERTRHRGRTLGTHWWNPPYLIPLVEVVQAEATDAEVIERMIGLLAWAGKTPVHVRKDVPGFVGNRLQHALWREAFRLVEQGICDPETVDVVVKSSFGRRLGVLGPIENADLVGLDLTLAIHEYLLPHLDRTPGPAATLRDKVARGELGMKSGKGFRTWREGEPAAVRERLLRYLASRTGADGNASAAPGTGTGAGPQAGGRASAASGTQGPSETEPGPPERR